MSSDPTMENKPRRPPSVWIAQGVLVFIGMIVFFIDAILFFAFLSTRTSLLSIMTNWLVLVLCIVVPAVLVGAFLGLLWRKNFGRWLSILAISGLIIVVVIERVQAFSDGTEFHGYDNSAQLAGSIVGRVIFCSALLVLLFRLAFSKQVSAFFLGKILAVPVEPPPQTPASRDY